jgi:hypothetical protein
VESSLRGLPVVRYAGCYAPWLVQRVLDDYVALDPADRNRVDLSLAGTGWEAVLAHQPRHRVAKRGYELVLDADKPREGGSVSSLDGTAIS